MPQIEITISHDLDSFLGSDPEAIATIDIEASQTAYENAVRSQVLKEYPEISSVIFAWGTTNYCEWAAAHADDNQAWEYFQSNLEDIEARIYNLQEFWVNK